MDKSSIEDAKILALKRRLEVVSAIPDMEDYAKELKEDIIAATLKSAERVILTKIKEASGMPKTLFKLPETEPDSSSLNELREKLYNERYK